MAYRDYICCRDCKSKFIYDGNDSIRNSLEATYGDEDAPNWTVELVCPNCLAKLERNPLTEEEVSNLAKTMVKGDKSVNWLCRAIEREHGIVSSQMQHIADLEAALAQPKPVMLNGLTEAETNASASVMGLTQPQRQPLRRGVNGVCTRRSCECEREGLGDQCIWLEPMAKVEPTCAAPPQRKPLTEEQIAEICMDCSLVTPSDIYFARAIEKAHGIE